MSEWPVQRRYRHLAEFLLHPGKLLSARATRGFLDRAERSSLDISAEFLDDVREHLRLVSASADA